jgi:hypothetical protein
MDVSVNEMPRLPPALAAEATTKILDLLGVPPARVLELGFAGIHAPPLRLAGFEVVVVEPDIDFLARASARAGGALSEPPAGAFDAVIAQEGADLAGVEARRVLLVRQDGSVWSSVSS